MRGSSLGAGGAKNSHDEPKVEPSVDDPAALGSNATATALDQLAYVSDMIDELRVMADRLRCATLSGVLDVARREAELEWRRRRDLSRLAPPGV